MNGSLRTLLIVGILCSPFVCSSVFGVGGIPCGTDAQCADECKTGDYCNHATGYCNWTGAEPAGKACASDGNNHTYDYCQSGVCQHLVDCSSYAGDYCMPPPHPGGGCQVYNCLPGDIDPSSPYNFQAWSCRTTTIANGSPAFFRDGERPPTICNKGWVCQGGAPVMASPFSFQDYQTCWVNQDPSAGQSKCDGVVIDRCRANSFVSDCFSPTETLRSITPYTTSKGYCYALVTASMLGGSIPAGKTPGWIELPSPQFATRMVDGPDPAGPATGAYVSVMTHDQNGAMGSAPGDYNLPVVVLEGFDPDNIQGWSNAGWNGLLFPALFGPNGIAYDGYDIVFVGQDAGNQSTTQYAREAARAMYASARGFPSGGGAAHYPYNGKVFVFGISEGGLVAKMVLSAWEGCYDSRFQTNPTRCPVWFPQELKTVDPVSVVAGALSADSPIEGAHAPRDLQSFLRSGTLNCILGIDVPLQGYLDDIGLSLTGTLDSTPAREMLIRWVSGGGGIFDANTSAARAALGNTVTPIFAAANKYGIGFPAQASGHGYPERVKLYALSEGAWTSGGVSHSVTNCSGWNDPIGCYGPAGAANITSPPTHMAWLDVSGSVCDDLHIFYLDPIDVGEGSAIAALPREFAYKMVQRNHGLPGIATSEGDVTWPGLDGDGLCNRDESHLNSIDCPRGPISGGQVYYAELPANLAVRFNWLRAWNYQPTASALGCYGADANGDRLPDSITPVSTQADCEDVVQNRGGFGFFDAYWQNKPLAHDAFVHEYKEMPKTYSFLRSVLDEHLKGDGDGYFDHCRDLSDLPPETEANYPTLSAEKWGKGKWKACDECPGDASSHTHAGCLSATQSSAGWKKVVRAGFPLKCVNAVGALSKPTLCPQGDLPQVIAVTLLDDNGQPLPGVAREEIVATGSCRLVTTAGTAACGPLGPNGAPTTWVNTLAADADSDSQGKTTITVVGAIGDCSDLRIVARGKTLAVLAFRNTDFQPRTGVNVSSGVVSSVEFNSLTAAYGRTDRDWVDFDCSGIVDSPDFNVATAHNGHKCRP